MTIAGLDIGTTACKCSLYRLDGSLVAESYQEYRYQKQKDKNELDANMVWECVQQAIAGVAEHAGELRAIGVTSFGESVVFADENGDALIPTMLYTDPRSAGQCRRLTEQLGDRHFADITGVKPHNMYSISKILWVKENQPEVYQKTKRLFLFMDYVVYRLSGVAQIDDSLAARTMAYDIRKRDWSGEVLEAAGVDKSLFSKVSRTGTAAGTIRPELARQLKIPADVVVVTGCHDQVAATVGCGVLRPGMAVDGTGTVECITPVFEGIPDDPVMYDGSYAIIPHVTPGRYVTYAFSFTGGALLKWFRDYMASAENRSYKTLDSQISDEPSGLLILPHFEGAATPYMDSDSVGAIVGMTTKTTQADIYRALMEGVTYEMMLNMEHLGKAGIEITELPATGGGAMSPIWLQMKADILGKKMISLGAAQSGTVGSIMLAGVACGLFPSLEEAAKIFVRYGNEYLPRPEQHAAYREHYEKYKRMYQAVKYIETGKGGF